MIMKTNHFITGDAVEELKKLPDASIDLICTDPPYNLCKIYFPSVFNSSRARIPF